VKQDRYNVLNGHFKNKLELDTNVAAAPLSEAEAQAYLGDLLLHSYRKDAYTYLEKAIKLDPNLAMAHASLGMAYFREGKVAEARASLERAVSLSSQNYMAHYYYAFTLSRLGPDGAPVTFTPELLAKIREHLQKAIELRPDFMESYNLLAFVSLVTGDNVEGAIASMKRALEVAPGRADFSLTLAQLYARSGDFKQARQMLEQIAKSNAEDHIRQSSEMILKQLQTMEENNARYEEAKKFAAANSNRVPGLVTVSSDPVGAPVPSAGSPPTITPAPPSDASSYLREVLRAPGAGETQIQATLLRIECDAKGIFFVVQTASGVLRLRTASFDEIEITTYDTSVKGDITCGERKPANSVVVDYLPTPDKRLKTDGVIKSIEFVPADFKLKP
jgi:Tfp pilus assembly protein PilF